MIMSRAVFIISEKMICMYRQERKHLSLVEVQLQGKKRMDTGSFLRGCHVEEGLIFHVIVIHYK